MRESKILKSNLIEIRRRKRFDFSIMFLASSLENWSLSQVKIMK